MTKLDFAHNELTGTIPPRLLTSFGNHLEKLYLIDNKLVGSIPTEVGHLKSLMTGKRSFLEREGSPATLIQFAIPGIVDEENCIV